jgi:hypothetical protein
MCVKGSGKPIGHMGRHHGRERSMHLTAKVKALSTMGEDLAQKQATAEKNSAAAKKQAADPSDGFGKPISSFS